MRKKIIAIVSCLILLTACTKSARVKHNLRNDADNYKVRRKVIVLNTRTNEALFTVEGYISLDTDNDGDLNVTIQTGENEYKLFYAHLSEDVTYTCIQLDSKETNEYAYNISFFPLKESLKHGIIDIESSEE